LVTNVGPVLEEVARENQEIWFQQNGCPAHFSLEVRNFLNDSFPNCWTGRCGAINWPARSPDLAPCSWGKIYKRCHPDINSLRGAITAQSALITERQLASVRNGFTTDWGIVYLFEHLL
jgi:hypothetical protein